MMTRFSLIILCLIGLSGSLEAQIRETPAARDARMRWWREARFGMFIHWGVYAIPARGEWVMYNEKIPPREYEKYPPHFDPASFDATAWVRLAKRAGMRYIVITSKHHDGFCLWPSGVSRYDIADASPFGRDVLGELAAACKREGIRFGLYHSIMDWHHPEANGTAFPRYRDEYMIPQLRELVGRYDPAVLWFDGEWIGEWTEEQGRDLYALLRRLKPDIVVNNRVGKGRLGMEGLDSESGAVGDFGTPEQQVPNSRLDGIDWESCMTMNGHWGYAARDSAWKSTRTLVRTLADIASKGGNYLLNIGPDAAGVIPHESVARLEEIGAWMHAHGEAIYGTDASPLPETPWGRCTMKRLDDGSTRLYLHVFDWPSDGVLRISALGNAPVRAFLLSEKFRGLASRHSGDTVSVSVPLAAPDTLDPVIVLEYADAPIFLSPPRVFAESDIFVGKTVVSFSPAARGAEIRYSLIQDGRAGPWQIYRAPLTLASSAIVQAQTWYAGHGVGPVVTRRLERHTLRPATKPGKTTAGLEWKYAEGSWARVPRFDTVRALANGIARAVSLDMRKREEMFAVEFTGFVRVPADGVYTFSLDSDDGATLHIGDTLLVDNDGFHGVRVRSGSMALCKGYHPLRIGYFNGTADRELRLAIRGAGGKKLPVPPMLFHSFTTRPR